MKYQLIILLVAIVGVFAEVSPECANPPLEDIDFCCEAPEMIDPESMNKCLRNTDIAAHSNYTKECVSLLIY